MNVEMIIVFLSYSINPFIRKQAISNLNDYTGYALIQTTTLIGNLSYLYLHKYKVNLNDITYNHIKFSTISSAITILSSYNVQKLLKKQHTSNLTTNIQVSTIISTYFMDYLINSKNITQKEGLGVLLMIIGLLIAKS